MYYPCCIHTSAVLVFVHMHRCAHLCVSGLQSDEGVRVMALGVRDVAHG